LQKACWKDLSQASFSLNQSTPNHVFYILAFQGQSSSFYCFKRSLLMFYPQKDIFLPARHEEALQLKTRHFYLLSFRPFLKIQFQEKCTLGFHIDSRYSLRRLPEWQDQNRRLLAIDYLSIEA
jgi:hypothetical protein